MVANKKAADVVPFGDDSEGWDEIASEFGNVVDPSAGPVIGTYQGFRVVELDDENSDEAEAKRNQTAHDLILTDGAKVTVWGSYDLDHKLIDYDTTDADGKPAAKYVGSVIRIDFAGEAKLKGGRTLKQYRVRVKQ